MMKFRITVEFDGDEVAYPNFDKEELMDEIHDEVKQAVSEIAGVPAGFVHARAEEVENG